jgi:hypothetical protein
MGNEMNKIVSLRVPKSKYDYIGEIDNYIEIPFIPKEELNFVQYPSEWLKEWNIVKKKVLQRDNYVCVICKKERATLVHHLLDKEGFPELSLRLELCISLCYGCHIYLHPFLFFAEKTFSEKDIEEIEIACSNNYAFWCNINWLVKMTGIPPFLHKNRKKLKEMLGRTRFSPKYLIRNEGRGLGGGKGCITKFYKKNREE